MSNRKTVRKDFPVITGKEAKEQYSSLSAYDFHQLVFPPFKSYLLGKSNGQRTFNTFLSDISLGDLDLDNHGDRAYVLSEMRSLGFTLPTIPTKQAS